MAFVLSLTVQVAAKVFYQQAPKLLAFFCNLIRIL